MRTLMTRREALLAAAVIGCSRRSGEATASPSSPSSSQATPSLAFSAQLPSAGRAPPTRLVHWDFDRANGGPEHAVVVLPEAPRGARFPLVIALHGRGEAVKSPEDGALGWPRDYALERAYARLLRPPLDAKDFEGFVTPAQLARANRALVERPFRGLVVVCPHSPDIDLRRTAEIRTYGRFLTDVLLPRARAELPILDRPASTGIDGVSLGGAIALRVGLERADLFGAVGAVQPAIQSGDAPAWADLVRAARARSPSVAVRLTTSEEDYFREGISRLSSLLRGASVAHDYDDFPGPHDYAFNRGPGSLTLLSWHDHLLARDA